MIIKIAGENVDYQWGSVDIDNAINARSTASFSIIDREGALSFQKGQIVEIYEQGKVPTKKWTDYNNINLTTWELLT